MPQRIAVVTVTYNSESAIGDFLDSVGGASATELEVVVADNGSTDLDIVRDACQRHGARFLALESNRGYGGGVNAAVATLPDSIEFIVISNPDVVFTAGSIDRLIAEAEAFPGAGSFGPQVVDADGVVYPSARRSPSLRTGIGHALFVNVWPGNPWTARYRNDQEGSTETVPVEWLSGSCLMVRRTAFEAVHGFDESYFMYFEDVDLGERLTAQGWKNLYVPTSQITHTGAHSTNSDPSGMSRVHHASAYHYLSRRYSKWYLLPVRVALRLALQLRSVWATRKR